VRALLIAVVLATLTAGLYLAFERHADAFRRTAQAPGHPGVAPGWTTGAKVGIGTAYFDPARGPARSHVWYTLAEGVLTEVLYPDVGTANVRTVELAVSDGRTFTDFEKDDTRHGVELVGDALVYRQVNVAKSGRYRIEKTHVTDPAHDALLVEVAVHALRGTSGYDVYLSIDPSVANTGTSDSAEVVERRGRTNLVARERDIALALTASAPLAHASVGFDGSTSDPADLVARSGRLGYGYREAPDGNVVGMARVGSRSEGRLTRFTFALGFGRSASAAIEQADGALARGFAAVLRDYRRGWHRYLASLGPAPSAADPRLYRLASMTLRAHEDKLHPGAFAAALAVPWGEYRSSYDVDRGYRLVRARDLYHIGTGLVAVGDRRAARRALAFLDDTMQRPDGSIAPAVQADGTPLHVPRQLDDTALGVVLAGQLDQDRRYPSLVRPAADYIVRHGPATPRDRWRDKPGYSPSTIAAEVAALVVAARMARGADEPSRARTYVATADRWASDVTDWTLAARPGRTLSPHFIHVSTTKNPDRNAAEARSVDAGFLELVRLGVKRPDDAAIVHSLDLVDRRLRWLGPHGPAWRRYTGDSYGLDPRVRGLEDGVGRPWPLLTGERAEYELALAASGAKRRPRNVYGPPRLLRTLASFANRGWFIPEQVWDGPRTKAFVRGEAEGSATPLAWAMAQYLRLAEGIRRGRPLGTPPETARHFGTR
jgi:glucoamylase